MRDTTIRMWKGDLPFVRAVFYPALYILSCLYGWCLAVRKKAYRLGFLKTRKSPVPVISVGNITLGGTGKTPVVGKIALWLSGEDFKPGIITRGYGRRRKGLFAVDPREDKASETGDEAIMLARNARVPVIVGADRFEAIERGRRDFAIDIAILDDGFQRIDLVKDIEVLVVNGSEERKMRRLFPLGSLREPLSRIKDAHMVLVNKGKPDREMEMLLDGIPIFQMRYRPAHLYNMRHNLIGPYRYLEGKRVLAFSGLGDNESFFALIESLGADVVHRVSFPDHHKYGTGDIKNLLSYREVEMFVTTEKDAVRLESMEVPGNFFYLAVKVEIDDEEKFYRLITEKIERRTWSTES